MLKFKATALAVSLACLGMGLGSTAVMAGDDDVDDFSVVINDDMPRRGPGTTSGSGDTVEANCAVDPSGNAWQDATATLKIEQEGSGSVAKIKIKDAVPDTLFTVWMRIKGGAGYNDGGSPWTGGGATPLCSGTNYADLLAISPGVDPAGADSSCNSFTTNSKGKGETTIALNFPVVGGAYPFQQSETGDPSHVPTAIVDPRTGNGGPFLLRVISHCTDNASHGLSPATREAWFQYP